ncbi:hypothetical protein MUK42_13066 [Musa troglodytarum]|uniref:TCP domain-containing protein n=1 Tax=Musa troglodytarum TaxID=320322 RepID=A0A9E7KCF1_9LILI|nr:hypothetical protein MUK42_13066 [Musa troglodytarum]
MEEGNRDCYKQHCQRRCTGELIEVPGGHIVRATGRKDRHSKVYTAKGVRDRRVRLSAHTAIQFYDVQDRLGYDRPSKAVDWLMQNAKTAIDQLADLSRCHAPVDRCVVHELPLQDTSVGHDSIELPMSDAGAVASVGYGFGSSSSSLIPPSIDGDAIDGLVKPFPTVTAAASLPSSHTMTYHDYTPDLLLHACGRPQDLGLSLRSFHDPTFRDHHHQSPESTQQFFCSGTPNLAHATTWETCPVNKERMGWWNAANPCDGSGTGEFSYNGALPPQSAAPRLVNAQVQLCTRREPLRSGNLPCLRAWTSPTAFQPSLASAAAGVFTSESYAGVSGFHIPERVQGEEPHSAIANDLQAASSASRQWQKWKENNDGAKGKRKRERQPGFFFREQANEAQVDQTLKHSHHTDALSLSALSHFALPYGRRLICRPNVIRRSGIEEQCRLPFALPKSSVNDDDISVCV